MARNGIPYQWLDIEDDQESRRLVSIAYSIKSDTLSMDSELSSGIPPFSDFSSLHLPLVLFPDGLFLVATNSQIAEKIGLKTRAQMAFYDLIIIGGGLAGLAAVYGASEGLHTLVVEKQHQEVKQALALKSKTILNFLLD